MQREVTRFYQGFVCSRQIIEINPAISDLLIELHRDDSPDKFGRLLKVITNTFVVIQVSQRRFFLVANVINGTAYAGISIFLINGTGVTSHVKYLTSKGTFSYQTAPITQVQRELVIKRRPKGAVNDQKVRIRTHSENVACWMTKVVILTLI